MYRAVTLYFIQNHVRLTDPKSVLSALDKIQITFHYNPKSEQNETYLNGLNVEREIRKMQVSERVSDVAAIPEVRHAMVAQQQRMGKHKGVVMDGRDIGTVVFPSAELKVFMNADFRTRAVRRQKELLEKEELVNLDQVMENLKTRDDIDTSRKESPLRKAEDAVEIDTTYFTFEEQVDEIIRLATTKMLNNVNVG